MEDYQPLFIILVAAGAVICLAGLIMWMFPPKKINHVYGYRTSQSMQSEEHWHFAQAYSAKLMVGLGAAFVGLGFVCNWLQFSDTIGTILALVIVVIGTVLLIIKTERELKKQIDQKQD
jgi:uncharacterized membrane protein